jgi:lipopolysaccharide export system permease protein
MPRLDRDLLSHFFQVLLGALCLVSVLLLVAVMLDYYRYIFAAEESRIGWVLMYYLYDLPGQMLFLLPVSASVAALWVLLQKARHNELLAWMASGVSPLRLARPLLLAAAAISLFGIGLNEFVATPARTEALRIEKVNIKGRSGTSITRNEKVLHVGPNDQLYTMESYDDDTGRMERPTIVQPRQDGGGVPEWTLKASHAVLARTPSGESAWTFHKATLRRFDAQGDVIEFVQKDTLTDAELAAPIQRRLERFLSKGTRPERMSFLELHSHVGLLTEQGRHDAQLATQLWMKLSVPFASLILILLMCAHALRPTHGGMLISLGGGLAWLAVFLGSMLGMQRLGDAGVVPGLVAAMLPQLAFGIAGIVMIRRTRFA